ncbi:MAG: hypothetical protein ACK2US_17410 [Anaerolineae bacterium]|jgi:hypothetical protein
MKRFLRENWLVFLVIGGMVGGYLFLRTPGDAMASTEEFDALVTSGTPTVLEFYSNT